MSSKRELIRLLKNLKNKPRLLSQSECNELIAALGGTTRPRGRPEVTIAGGSLRRGNWTAVAEVVFGFLENAEQLSSYEIDLAEIDKPEFLRELLKTVSAENRHSYKSYLEKRIPEEREYLNSMIQSLQPRSAKSLAEAKKMASNFFTSRGKTMSVKQIENQLSSIREAAGLNKLGLSEWRSIKKKHNQKTEKGKH